MWRQGDVLIQAVSALPDGLVPQKRPVLASSDSTGHAHRIRNPEGVRLFSRNFFPPEQFLEVINDAVEIVHPEHAAITLAKGCYRVWRQREFDGFGDRQVRD